jgi:hypothetical protein
MLFRTELSVRTAAQMGQNTTSDTNMHGTKLLDVSVIANNGVYW